MQLELGDSIKVKALGDGEEYEDSSFSKTVTYEEVKTPQVTVPYPTDTEYEDFMSIEEIIEIAKNNYDDPYYAPEITGTPNFDGHSYGYYGGYVEITFYHTMGSVLRDVLDKYICEFNELYPNGTFEDLKKWAANKTVILKVKKED